MATPEDRKVLKRAEVFLKVQCKLMKVADAARELGIARPTYYKWEKKGIAALKEAFSDGQGGRPCRSEDPQVEYMQKQLQDLKIQNELLKMRLEVQQLMAEEMPANNPRWGKSRGYRHGKKNG